MDTFGKQSSSHYTEVAQRFHCTPSVLSKLTTPPTHTRPHTHPHPHSTPTHTPTHTQRLRAAGAFISTSESVIFELLGDSKHPKFKEVQPLIKTSAPDSGLLSKVQLASAGGGMDTNTNPCIEMQQLTIENLTCACMCVVTSWLMIENFNNQSFVTWLIHSVNINEYTIAICTYSCTPDTV